MLQSLRTKYGKSLFKHVPLSCFSRPLNNLIKALNTKYKIRHLLQSWYKFRSPFRVWNERFAIYSAMLSALRFSLSNLRASSPVVWPINRTFNSCAQGRPQDCFRLRLELNCGSGISMSVQRFSIAGGNLFRCLNR